MRTLTGGVYTVDLDLRVSCQVSVPVALDKWVLFKRLLHNVHQIDPEFQNIPDALSPTQDLSKHSNCALLNQHRYEQGTTQVAQRHSIMQPVVAIVSQALLSSPKPDR